MPNCPALLRPQQKSCLSTSSAQLFSPPAKIDIAELGSALFAGTRISASIEFVTWPLGFAPQHHTVPSLATTHVCDAPAAIFTATRPPGNPSARTGTVDLLGTTLLDTPN
jgi:hypothetical protein